MMSKAVVTVVTITAFLLLAGWSPSVGTDQAATDPKDDSPGGIHPDPDALMAAFLDAARAVVVGDNKGLKAALDRVQKGCERIGDLDDTPYPPAIRNIDQAFHSSVNIARELAGDEKTRQAYEQYLWVERGCWLCHSAARKQGLMPVGSFPEDQSPD